MPLKWAPLASYVTRAIPSAFQRRRKCFHLRLVWATSAVRYVTVFGFRRLPCSMPNWGASVSLMFWSHNSQLFPQQLFLFVLFFATLRDRREQITDIYVFSEFLKMYFHVVFHVSLLRVKLLAGDSAANVKLAVFSTSLTTKEHTFPPRRDRTWH